ncbi:MAG: flagellar hook-length control protein FliK [Rickettsiales bacterium]|nr:MAG: flagellar hook-length control protein FliK [Rickettsiales bacterium]
MSAAVTELLSTDSNTKFLKSNAHKINLNLDNEKKLFQINQETKESKKIDNEDVSLKIQSEQKTSSKQTDSDDEKEIVENEINIDCSLLNPILNNSLLEIVEEKFILDQENIADELLENNQSDDEHKNNILEFEEKLLLQPNIAMSKDINLNSLNITNKQDIKEAIAVIDFDGQGKQTINTHPQQKIVVNENIKEIDLASNIIQADESKISKVTNNVEVIKSPIIKQISNPQLNSLNVQFKENNNIDKQITLSSAAHSNVILADTNIDKKTSDEADLSLINTEDEIIIDTASKFENFDKKNNNDDFKNGDELLQFSPLKNNIRQSNSSVISYPKLETQVSNAIMELSNNTQIGKNEVIVNLFPEELGSITVKIVSIMGEDNGKKIQNIKITCQNQQTAEILENNRKDLDKILKTITSIDEETKLEFEMGKQPQDQNSSYFENNEDRNNWMKNFVHNELEFEENEKEEVASIEENHNSNSIKEEHSQTNFNIMV